MSEYVGAAELASWLDCTPRRVQQLVSEGVIERSGRGRYLLKECVLRYVRFQNNMVAKKGTTSELSEEKLLTARLERRKRELEFAEIEGSVVSVEHHRIAMSSAFSLVRRNIRNLPGSLAPRLVGLDDARSVMRILVPAIDGALRSIVEEGKTLASDKLPDSAPGRSKLMAAGVTTMDQVSAIDDFTVITGIGPKTAEQISRWRDNL